MTAWCTCNQLFADCLHTETSFNCVKYLYAYDGDTITVEIPGVHPLFGKNISVRVFGVDTPELHSKVKCEKELALIAKANLESIISKAKVVNLVDVGRDKYFRVLATVMVDGQDLGKLMLQRKLAKVYDGGTKDTKWCTP